MLRGYIKKTKVRLLRLTLYFLQSSFNCIAFSTFLNFLCKSLYKELKSSDFSSIFSKKTPFLKDLCINNLFILYLFQSIAWASKYNLNRSNSFFLHRLEYYLPDQILLKIQPRFFLPFFWDRVCKSYSQF